MSTSLKLYNELASWWPLMSAPEDYEIEASFYSRVLAETSSRPIRTVLELGSGGGNNASHMKASFDMSLVEPSPGMLDVSRALNPELEHIQGDMRTVRLNRQFDAVFVHDAICYMVTETDLRRAIQTAWVHTAAGGAALFAPDHVAENFRPSTDHGGHDDGRRGLRYLEWTWDPDPGDASYIVDYSYMLRTPDGRVQVEHDRHVEGLFGRETWLTLLAEAGFEARALPLEHPDVEPGVHEVFAARRTGN